MQSTEESTSCPHCGHVIPVDRRYVTWCDKCDWNIDPSPPNDQTPAWRLRIEHRLAESLYGELAKGAVRPPRRDAARAGAHGLSVLILLLPVLGFLGGIALLVFYRPLWLSIVFAVVAFSLALLLRPRVPRLTSDIQVLHPPDAPTLYAVLDQLADAVGTKRVTAVAVTTAPNVWYLQVGWRLRPVVGLGLPLWTGLSPQERVAILAHEFGHGRHGDVARGWLLRSARSVLDELGGTFSEQPLDRLRRQLRYRDRSGATLVNRMLNFTVGALVRAIGWLLERLYLRSSQRAEYLADLAAAEIAGSEATAQALERTLLADTAYRAMERALRRPAGIEPLEAVRRAVTEVPAREIERRIRASRHRETRTDSTHPPTYLRTKLLRTRPATASRVTLSLAASQAIDRELAVIAGHVLARAAAATR